MNEAQGLAIRDMYDHKVELFEIADRLMLPIDEVAEYIKALPEPRMDISQRLVILRGLPGSGKSTAARCIRGVVCSTNDYFIRNGKYEFNPSKLGEAHTACREKAKGLLERGQSVVIDNTNMQRWEYEAYIDMAFDTPNCRLLVLHVYDGGLSDEELFSRNTHGVPLEAIKRMRARWEGDMLWKVSIKKTETQQEGNKQ